MGKSSSDSAKTSTSTAEASGVTRRSPSTIPKVFNTKDPTEVQANIYSVYGSKVSLQLATDLLAFVEKAVKGDYAP